MDVRVLIADDDADFRRVARKALAARGYEVVAEAATLAAARAAIGDWRPDAVLLDVNLPDGSGIALAQELAATNPGPRVLLTSSDDAVTGDLPFVPKTELLVTDLTPYLG